MCTVNIPSVHDTGVQRVCGVNAYSLSAPGGLLLLQTVSSHNNNEHIKETTCRNMNNEILLQFNYGTPGNFISFVVTQRLNIANILTFYCEEL